MRLGGLSELFDDEFGFGAAANRPPESKTEALELFVEDGEHCREWEIC